MCLPLAIGLALQDIAREWISRAGREARAGAVDSKPFETELESGLFHAVAGVSFRAVRPRRDSRSVKGGGKRRRRYDRKQGGCGLKPCRRIKELKGVKGCAHGCHRVLTILGTSRKAFRLPCHGGFGSKP